MPRACSVCGHEATAEIAKAIAVGGTNRQVAERFGLTHGSIQRHRTNCLKAPRRIEKVPLGDSTTSQAATKRFDSSDPKTLISTTIRLVDEALDLMEHAKRADDRRTALTALREARDGLSLLMKAAGMLGGDNATINVDARRQSIKVLAGLSEDEIRSFLAGSSTVADVTEKGCSHS